MDPTIVKGSSIARPDLMVLSRAALCSCVSFSESLGSSGMEELLLEKQFAGAFRRFHYGFDERDTQLSFFEFHDSVDGATGWRRHRVFQQRRMVARFEHHARRALHRLRCE